MVGGILLRTLYRKIFAVFEGKHGLVLGAVVFEDAMNVFPPRNAPNKKKKQRDANSAIHQVKGEGIVQRGHVALQSGRCQQWHKFIHEDEECERKNEVYGGHPTRDLNFFFFLGLRIIECYVG